MRDEFLGINQVKIVGTGLIGTSIALGLAQHGVGLELVDSDSNSLSLAKDLLSTSIKSGKPDLVVIATPPTDVFGALQEEFEQNPQSTFIDVASTKYNLVQKIESLSALSMNFVGTHPMAGREFSGASHAQADLFQGRAWIVTPTSITKNSSLSLATQLIQMLGATVYEMPAKEHDQLLALISHLPQMVSTALAAALQSSEREAKLAGQGLRDMTRIADSNPELWSQILLENQGFVLDCLEGFGLEIEALKKALSASSKDQIEQIFRRGNAGRAKVGGKHGAQSRNYRYLMVVIKDEPGALSKLFNECAAINANIEELSIEHSPGQLTGLITLAFSPEDASRVHDHLLKKNWKVHLR